MWKLDSVLVISSGRLGGGGRPLVSKEGGLLSCHRIPNTPPCRRCSTVVLRCVGHGRFCLCGTDFRFCNKRVSRVRIVHCMGVHGRVLPHPLPTPAFSRGRDFVPLGSIDRAGDFVPVDMYRGGDFVIPGSVERAGDCTAPGLVDRAGSGDFIARQHVLDFGVQRFIDEDGRPVI